MKKLAYISVIGLIAVSCGTGTSQENNNSANAEGLLSVDLSADAAAQEALVADLVEDVAEFMDGGSNETDNSPETSASLTSATFSSDSAVILYGLEKSLDLERDCSDEEPNQVISHVKLSGEANHVAYNGKASFKRSVSGSRERIWMAPETAPDNALACQGNYVSLDWKNSDIVKGLKLDIRVDVDRSGVLQIGKREAQRSLSRKGSRSFVWTEHSFDGEANIYSITKELSADYSKEFTSMRGRSFSSQHKTLEPLVIEVQRSGDNGARLSHKIASGTIEVVKANGTVITASYDNLLAETESGCFPISGKIEGERKVIKALEDGNEEEKTQNFALAFSEDENGESSVTFTVEGHQVDLPSFKDLKGFGASLCKSK